MKKLICSTSALAAVLILASTGLAHADTTPGWYVDVGAGVAFTPKLTTETPGHRTADFDTGLGAFAGGGYAWNNGLRAEGEIFRSRAAVNGIEGSVGSNGGLNNTDFFVNGLYDFNMNSMFTPYVGVGIGFAVPGADHIGTLANGSTFDDTDFQFAYQAIAGVSAQLDPNWAVTADYRYVATTDASYSTLAGTTGTMENASHNLMLGLRYSFGAPVMVAARTAAIPAVHSVAAAKPAVAAVAQSYEVFFDFDKSVLTPEAKNILAAAAKDYRAGKYVKIVVTGHTDTVGTAKYNDKLSIRRAKAVKTELVAQGVGINAIVAEGVGENSLMVPTADGVREAQNRRAEIVFKK